MPRPRSVQPAYLHHKPTNQASVRIPDGSGGRKVVYLGAHGSAESKAEYRRLLAKLDAAASPAIAAKQEPTLTGTRDLLVSEVYRDLCRPGEACELRWCDIGTGSGVWFFRARQHKTAWRGKARVVAIGPRAQEVLKAFPTSAPTDHLFNPRRAVEELPAARREPQDSAIRLPPAAQRPRASREPEANRGAEVHIDRCRFEVVAASDGPPAAGSLELLPVRGFESRNHLGRQFVEHANGRSGLVPERDGVLPQVVEARDHRSDSRRPDSFRHPIDSTLS